MGGSDILTPTTSVQECASVTVTEWFPAGIPVREADVPFTRWPCRIKELSACSNYSRVAVIASVTTHPLRADKVRCNKEGSEILCTLVMVQPIRYGNGIITQQVMSLDEAFGHRLTGHKIWVVPPDTFNENEPVFPPLHATFVTDGAACNGVGSVIWTALWSLTGIPIPLQ